MISLIDLRSRDLSHADVLSALPRPTVDVSVASDSAEKLISAVRSGGSAALLEQAERFDRVRPTALRVPQKDIDGAVLTLDPSVREALTEAIGRVRRATAAQIPPQRRTEMGHGASIVQRWQPVERVGLYVPGGKAVYPSSVVMNVVPAQVAGVTSIALASPAQREFDGGVHPTILGAAGLLGITEVYAMGGAGAIGAFAYGVPDLGLAPVDVVTGPGNIYVAAAKRLVRGQVGIDSEAGTTEILIIADGTADARHVAADLVSQAEHDDAAASVLVTDSPRLAHEVTSRLDELVEATANGDRARRALSGPQSAIVLVSDIPTAAEVSNAYGPEHLEIQTHDPHGTLEHITSAGAIFLGSYTPVSLGDYLAGSNHVLPTGGQARFAAGLGAYTFLRPQQIIEYERAALQSASASIVALANAERLPAHGEAVTERFEA
ncbi:histidinol dehydrogenase [Microbacterium sp. MPKO10]|uniref:histidinol dehydrogenase n=1 Tax=Microbacterium sp. MPKO10 TaxID=2989818 RepID=UPI0022363707|nr:histidinol dehydrogenase [Microbacterium sp. MPKO10]MCW4459416.1 histidinol dehydrogenase [Microbacterium sp. MPKO10]